MRRFSLLSAFLALVSASALAAPSLSFTSLVLSQSKDADDEEDPTPAAKTAPAKTTPADAPKASTTSPATGDAAAAAARPLERAQLVSGAPLNNPNVAVHTVEQKQFSDSGKRELVFYPLALQINGKFSQHVGMMGTFLWHLQENFGLMITGGYNYYNQESTFVSEITERLLRQPSAATALLWTWAVMGGAEVRPFYGKFAIFENALAHFSFVINGGLGAGGSRVQLKGDTGPMSPATFGLTEPRFMATIGLGFRLQLGSRFTLRMEVRDVVYAARVERINGCSYNEIRLMEDRYNRMMDVAATETSAGCDKSAFTGVDESGYVRSRNLSLAKTLVQTPSSDVLNNVGLYVGASVLF